MGSNSSYNCTPFLHSLLTKGKKKTVHRPSNPPRTLQDWPWQRVLYTTAQTPQSGNPTPDALNQCPKSYTVEQRCDFGTASTGLLAVISLRHRAEGLQCCAGFFFLGVPKLTMKEPSQESLKEPLRVLQGLGFQVLGFRVLGLRISDP